MKRSSARIAKASACIFIISVLVSCGGRHDSWWNADDHQAGTYRCASIEGSNPINLDFSTSTFFVISPIDDESEAKTFRENLRNNAPAGIWSTSRSNPGSNPVLKLQWYKCYFETMPSMDFGGAKWDFGQWYQPIWETLSGNSGEKMLTEWARQYPKCYENDGLPYSDGVDVYFKPHQEDGVIVQIKVQFVIENICDITMMFDRQ